MAIQSAANSRLAQELQELRVRDQTMMDAAFASESLQRDLDSLLRSLAQ